MIPVDFTNYATCLYAGATLLYDNRVGIVEVDSGWNGGFKINGRSIKNILEEYDNVYLVRK
jgi:hypothetical protein